jgi:SH3-like domain-containing protein
MRQTFWLTLAAVLLLAGPAFPSTMKSIGKDRVNVRSQPNLQSKVIYEAFLGYPIHIEKQKKDWVYCTDWKDTAGWVYKPLISNTQTAVVLVEDANIRKGPSLRKPVVLQASQGEIFKIFGEKGDWVKVGYYLENEVVGWIRDDLVWGE